MASLMASSNDWGENIKIRAPETPAEWAAYYDLRYRILRQPWGASRGSERDDLENIAIHRIAVETATGRIIGCGRIHRRPDGTAQIRFMAVEEGFQRKGIGSMLLDSLEQWARDQGIRTIILNARTTAVNFYHRQGYRVTSAPFRLYGSIDHVTMQKDVA